ncbi:restriction endonuclease subunit S [Rummeliibacillus sp. SL167]|uniref:restriction endonuclease subunit S n=1 Tax=Rummeliibacillus sp. SL167 TaxID=2579792 RepID=UPI0011B473DD|nr:restriction endonuclease subunit S [Rummeliibacillus sp. SL167]
MKESGIEWIGKIPKNWEVNKLKNYFTFSKGRNAAKYTKEFVSAIGEYPVYSGQTENNGILGYTETFEYDLNECLFTTTVGAKVMTLRLLKGRFSLSQNCLIMQKKKKSNIDYFYYFLQSLFEYEKSRIPSYMQPSLRVDDLNGYKVIIPDENEQEKIAKFLNYSITLVDNLIVETRETIRELKKYKQSIITETVTKGLDPNVKMKDSGIEWIGKVPEAWDVIKINRLFSIKKEIANKTGYDVLSVTQRGLKVKDITQNEGQMAADYSKYQKVQPDDFVMNHMDLLTGWVDLAVQEGVTSPDYRVFYNKQKELVFNRFYLYVFQICYLNKIFYGLGQGVSNYGRWRLQTDKFLNFYLPLPTLKEQTEIVNYLDFQTQKVDSLIQDKEKAIEELEKYKKSLIYEYVTGKKQV